MIEEIVFIVNDLQVGPKVRWNRNCFEVDLFGVDLNYFNNPLEVIHKGEVITKGEADIRIIVERFREWIEKRKGKKDVAGEED